MFANIKQWYKNIPDNKKWVDLTTAVLTIPVLLTVIATNIGNFQKKGITDSSTQKIVPTVERIIIHEVSSSSFVQAENIIPTISCITEIPLYEISYPQENDKLDSDPVCVVFRKISEANSCHNLWAYRVNNSSWSTYSDDPICLYNMASGPVKLEVRTKSFFTGEEKTYTRNFTYVNPASSIKLLPTAIISTPSQLVSPTPLASAL